jgi:hypothetical protein
MTKASKLSQHLTPDQAAAIEAANARHAGATQQVATLEVAKPQVQTSPNPIADQIATMIPMTNPEQAKAIGIAPVVHRDIKSELLAMREKDRKPVRGMFKFYESIGGTMSFSYRKYAQDEVATYTLTDGQVHTIPLGVAKHLNTNGWYPTYTYMNDEHGRPVTKVGKKNRRFGFQSLEFTEGFEEEKTSNLYTVQSAF